MISTWYLPHIYLISTWYLPDIYLISTCAFLKSNWYKLSIHHRYLPFNYLISNWYFPDTSLEIIKEISIWYQVVKWKILVVDLKCISVRFQEGIFRYHVYVRKIWRIYQVNIMQISLILHLYVGWISGDMIYILCRYQKAIMQISCVYQIDDRYA